MKKTNEKTVKKIDLEYRYDHHPTLRRSGMSKSGWEYVVHKFGIAVEPQKVMSITIEGEDDYGHLLLSCVMEE